MSHGYARHASAMYQQTLAQGSVEGADPHRLTQMLMDGAIERMAQARSALQHGDVAGMGARVGKAIAIVNELRGALDHEIGGGLAGRLEALYDYVLRRLLQAQLDQDDAGFAECIELLNPLREAWRDIRGEYLAGRGAAA